MSTSYVVTVVLYMGVVLYAPCLAIKTMTGLPVLGVIVLGGVIGTFYTVLVSADQFGMANALIAILGWLINTCAPG